MLFGFDLNHLFLFPFHDREARKHFLIGCLIYLAGFVILIHPWLAVTGYSAILVRQVLKGEKPHLVPWENWETLLKDGARLLGVRLIYSLPLFILIVPMFLMFFAMPLFPVITQNGNGESAGITFFLLTLVFTGVSLLILPLSMIIALIIPAAETHVVANDDFSAGFRVRDWWPIFKKNWGGFLVAVAIVYGVFMIMSVLMQIMLMTLVFLCLLPLFIPALSMYTAVVQYTAFAQAYKDGRDRLALSAPTA